MAGNQRSQARHRRIKRARKQKGCVCLGNFGRLCKEYPHLGIQRRRVRTLRMRIR